MMKWQTENGVEGREEESGEHGGDVAEGWKKYGNGHVPLFWDGKKGERNMV